MQCLFQSIIDHPHQQACYPRDSNKVNDMRYNERTVRGNLQRHIQNPVEHQRLSFLRKWLKTENR